MNDISHISDGVGSADESAGTSVGESSGRYLCFTLGADKFAIPLLQVKEVIGNIEITSIPQSPSHFKGIMNLRGQIISVVDLRSKLKMGKSDAAIQTTIILLDLNPLSLGMVVDSVDNVVTYDASQISQPPYADKSVKLGFITGIARTDNSLTLILDLKTALNAADYKINKNPQQTVETVKEYRDA